MTTDNLPQVTASKRPKPKRVLSRHPKAIAARKLARERRRGGGGRAPGGPTPTIDSPASLKIDQKGDTSAASGSEVPVTSATVSTGVTVFLSNITGETAGLHGNRENSAAGIGITGDSAALEAILGSDPYVDTPLGLKNAINAQDRVRPDPHPWGDGSFRAAIYVRPVNPRLLLVVFPNGDHGRLVIAASERGKFNIGQEVWVKPAGGKDLHILCGSYNRFGRRVR